MSPGRESVHSSFGKMGQARNWTKEEEEYLIEKWGTVSIKQIAKKLNRTENAVVLKKQRLGLGAFLESGEYVTFNQLHIALGMGTSSGYKMISWVKNRNFPLHTKRVNKNTYKVVYLDEWWEWAEKNKDLLDFSKFEENLLGEEPQWTKEKRKHDVAKVQKYITTPWTKAEDSRLIHLVEKHKYSYSELSTMLRRTNGAIQRRLCDLGVKDRPVKADNHTLWTQEELLQLGELIKAGYGYELLAEALDKSAKACRGKIYATYLTENLDKVRAIMGEGTFGDNRPARQIKQWNVMNTEERIEAKESLTVLTALLQYRFMQQVNETEWGEFFQKDMCQNFCKDCFLTEGCDYCSNYKKIEPQNCKMCGKTFWERKDNLYCATCRTMRKKQWLRKRFVLSR